MYVINRLFLKAKVFQSQKQTGMLFAYEKWLKTERTLIRINQLGKEVTTIEKGMQSGGVYLHMRDLRIFY